ncbi:MAG: hypothetical protein IGR76_09075 [Synechococcales cyanobacterium T60_A2020_003]|nr:hypothetical protein [Synechococcales cyanobacterium T60_A2020_003]
MVRSLTEAEVGVLVLRLALAGFVPAKDFKITDDGQVLASPDVRAFLKRTTAWAPEEREAGSERDYKRSAL